MSNQYRPGGFANLPPVVKNLLIINVLFFVGTYLVGSTTGKDLTDILGLRYPLGSAFRPFQFVTYMFMHGSLSHLFFNMFALWMFGRILENVWGSKRFLIYYMVCGIGAALTHYLVAFFEINPVIQSMDAFLEQPNLQNLSAFIGSHKFHLNENSGILWDHFLLFQNQANALTIDPQNHAALQESVRFIEEYRAHFLNLPNVVGASGAVFGLLLAFGMLFPNSEILIYFLFPLKAKWFVVIYGAIELIAGFADSTSNVAHFAHLGGMIFGYLLIRYWRTQKIY
ncbi:MAG: rhomboid family intramembrane serine protease [Bacteroidetes bacterium]|nr:MAG: rhomboid family intramembrane serine protease [Bacteroidota bacterium]PIE87684.1 MAG: rhomboid family intramembrane serine protease [Bacteroidota bacterium]